ATPLLTEALYERELVLVGDGIQIRAQCPSGSALVHTMWGGCRGSVDARNDFVRIFERLVADQISKLHQRELRLSVVLLQARSTHTIGSEQRCYMITS